MITVDIPDFQKDILRAFRYTNGTTASGILIKGMENLDVQPVIKIEGKKETVRLYLDKSDTKNLEQYCRSCKANIASVARAIIARELS